MVVTLDEVPRAMVGIWPTPVIPADALGSVLGSSDLRVKAALELEQQVEEIPELPTTIVMALGSGGSAAVAGIRIDHLTHHTMESHR